MTPLRIKELPIDRGCFLKIDDIDEGIVVLESKSDFRLLAFAADLPYRLFGANSGFGILDATNDHQIEGELPIKAITPSIEDAQTLYNRLNNAKKSL